MAESVERTWPDIHYRVVAEVHEYHLDFRAYRIVGYDDGRPVFEQRRASDEDRRVVEVTPTDRVDAADWFARGMVQWDGGTDVRFNRINGIGIHAADREELEGVGTLLARIHDLASFYVRWWSHTHEDQ